MANSMGDAWICGYLIDVGERVGGALTKEPYRDKKKKVQLIEFLTAPHSEDDQCHVWGIVSDKLHKIPVRFTGDALKGYRMKYSTSPLTSHLGAVVAIKDFRPVFTRIPLPNNCRTMSAESYLAFEVDSINILGSDGESIFGSPKTVEENVKVKAWADDQRKMGGNGNILKLMKEAEQVPVEAEASARSSRALSRKVATPPPAPSKQKGKKRADSSPPESGSPVVLGSKQLMSLYKKPFRHLVDPWKLGFKPQEIKEKLRGLSYDKTMPVASTSRAVNEELAPLPAQRPRVRRSPPKEHALDLGSSQPVMRSPEHEIIPSNPLGSPTASEWPPSQTNSDSRANEMDVDVPEDQSHEASTQLSPSAQHEESLSFLKVSSQLSSPTPAQRRPSPVPPCSSGPNRVFSSTSVPTLRTATDFRPSLPLPLPDDGDTNIKRRVPYPAQPPPPDRHTKGPGRVLVPNSDTSGACASQSQSQSQPQTSQFIFFPPSQNASRPQPNQVSHVENAKEQSPRQKRPSPPRLPDGLSQPMSYDGDNSSPEVPRLRNRGRKQSISEPSDPAEEHAMATSLQKTKARKLEHVNEEAEVAQQVLEDVDDKAQHPASDDEPTEDESTVDEEDPPVVTKESQKRALSPDDAQVHAILHTRDSEDEDDDDDEDELSNSCKSSPEADEVKTSRSSSPIAPNLEAPTSIPIRALSTVSTSDSSRPASPVTSGTQQPPPPAGALDQKKHLFLSKLSSVMIEKGNALPPAFTGVPNPEFDPKTWRLLGTSAVEPGVLQLSNQKIDVFQLWGFVSQAGGSIQLTESSWTALASLFGLPEKILVHKVGNQRSMEPASRVLRHYYKMILGTYEEWYSKNTAAQNHQASQDPKEQSGHPRGVSVGTVDSIQARPKFVAPSLPQVPPGTSGTEHLSSTGLAKLINKLVPSAVSPKQESKAMSPVIEVEHDANAWARPSFMNTVAIREAKPKPTMQPRTTASMASSNKPPLSQPKITKREFSSRPESKYRTPGPVASSSRATVPPRTEEAAPSSSGQSVTRAPPPVAFSSTLQKLTIDATRKLNPAKVALLSQPLSRQSSTSSTDPNKRDRNASRESSHGPRVDLTALASTRNRARPVLGRTPSAAGAFIRAAGIQFAPRPSKRSRDSEAEVSAQLMGDPERDKKRRKVEGDEGLSRRSTSTSVTTTTTNTTGSSRSKTDSAHSFNGPRKGTILRGYQLDMRDMTAEEANGPPMNMDIIDACTLYCGRRRR